MAKSVANYRSKTRRVVTETLEKVPDGVTLELSAAEADVLAVILSKVGGDPQFTDRRLVDEITHALRVSGYCFTKFTIEERRRVLNGGISFVGHLPERE